MTEYGNYRSARESRDWVTAWEAAHALKDDLKDIAIKDWWRNAGLEIVAPKLIWSYYYYGRATCPALECIDESEWNCTLGGISVVCSKTLDLQPLQTKWATVPAKEVLPIWEEWAEVYAPENVNLCKNLIELIDQGTDPHLILEAHLVAKIYGQVSPQATAAFNAAWYATRSAYNARLYASSAPTAAYNAALYALSAKNAALCAEIPAQDEEWEKYGTANWERYNDMFALYVLEHLRYTQGCAGI